MPTLTTLKAAATVVASPDCPDCRAGTYGHRDFSGTVDRVSSCTWHVTHGFFLAGVTNQTPGTRARFYDYYRHFLAVSQPAPRPSARFGNVLGHQTHYIRPC